MRAQAALNAGFVRFRPVLMTALAMIIGMVPMALGLGEGGEQNAPLGRAVIGGLLLATVATLFFVPAFFSVVHGWLEAAQARGGTRQRAATFDEFDSHARFRSSIMSDTSNPNPSQRHRRTRRRPRHTKFLAGTRHAACAGAAADCAGRCRYRRW